MNIRAVRILPCVQRSQFSVVSSLSRLNSKQNRIVKCLLPKMVSAALAHLEKVPKYYVALKNLVHGNVKIMFHLLMHFGGTIPRSLSFLSCMKVASTGGLSHYRQALKHVGLRINKRLLYSYLWGLILKHVACIDTGR